MDANDWQGKRWTMVAEGAMQRPASERFPEYRVQEG